MSSNSAADVHFALATLHESGRLAMLQAALQAAAEGRQTIADTQHKPNYEAALFHYQMSAFLGNCEAMMIMAQIHAGFQPVRMGRGCVVVVVLLTPRASA